MPINPIYSSNSDRGRPIEFDVDIIQKFDNEQWQAISRHIKHTFKIERHVDGSIKKMAVSTEVLHYFDKWLKSLSTKIDSENEELLEVVTDILRSLRNCVSNAEYQMYISEHTDILLTCSNILAAHSPKLTNQNSLCLKMLLQFLINLITSNKASSEKVCVLYLERVIQCLKDEVFVYECSALIYNILLALDIPNAELMNVVFQNYNNDGHHNEYLSFILEHYISKEYFWCEYGNFTVEYRIAILEVLKHLQRNRKSHGLPSSGLETLINSFLHSLDVVFHVFQGKENDRRGYEVALIVEIMSSLSSDERYLQNLQKSKDLLINAGVLLINMHKLGKVSDNCFTPVQKLSEFTDKTELKDHPAFGFKADLIRLIGNLCWKNADMQNLVRESDLIPVILDCCNMDAKNPFIIQWSILAVRNVCENNLENQNFIANLHQEGVVGSQTLEEFGLTLDSNGESSLKIVPFDSLKRHCS